MTAVHPWLDAIPRRLHVRPEWTHHSDRGTAFLVEETGCWISISEDTLHIEVRAALQVHDLDTAVSFCDARNNLALVGRWVYDAAHGVVALVADLALADGAGFDAEAVAVELVAELVNAVSTVMFKSAPQRMLNGTKATPCLDGTFPTTRNRTNEHLPRVVYPLGQDQDTAIGALAMSQDVLLEPLLDFAVEHYESLTVAEREDGARLVLRAAQHPVAGWGLVIALRPAWTADPVHLNTLNMRAAGTGEHVLGRWTTNVDTVEHRLFLTNAMLQAAGPVWQQASFVAQLVARLSDQPGGSGTDDAAVQRPGWPGDELAIARARRQPWNDHRDDDDPEWYAIYLDTFERGSTLTEPSYRAWLQRLEPGDEQDPSTARFIAFMDARIQDRDERIREHGTHLPDEQS